MAEPDFPPALSEKVLDSSVPKMRISKAAQVEIISLNPASKYEIEIYSPCLNNLWPEYLTVHAHAN